MVTANNIAEVPVANNNHIAQSATRTGAGLTTFAGGGDSTGAATAGQRAAHQAAAEMPQATTTKPAAHAQACAASGSHRSIHQG